MLAKVANNDTQTVVSALIKQSKTLPNELYKFLTGVGNLRIIGDLRWRPTSKFTRDTRPLLRRTV
jgi:hypothetical protein